MLRVSRGLVAVALSVATAIGVAPSTAHGSPSVERSTPVSMMSAIERVGTTPARTPAFNGLVRTIAYRGSRVYVGGDFTRVTDSRGTRVRRYAAAFNARTGRVVKWNPRVNGRVNDFVVTRSSVYLGGAFTRAKGKKRLRIAQLTRRGKGELLRFRPRVNGTVSALSRFDRRLYAGGSFTSVNRRARGHLAAFTKQGRLARWRPSASKGAVYDLAATSAGVHLAGNFNQINRVSGSRRLALVNRRSGAVVRSFNPPVDKPIFELALNGSHLFAAAGGTGGGFAAAYVRSSGAQVWLRRFDGDVVGLALHGAEVYVGGHFDELCDTDNADPVDGDCLGSSEPRAKVAALTLAGALHPWNPGANSVRGVKAVQGLGTWGLAIGGDFTIAGGQFRQRLAIFP